MRVHEYSCNSNIRICTYVYKLKWCPSVSPAGFYFSVLRCPYSPGLLVCVRLRSGACLTMPLLAFPPYPAKIAIRRADQASQTCLRWQGSTPAYGVRTEWRGVRSEKYYIVLNPPVPSGACPLMGNSTEWLPNAPAIWPRAPRGRPSGLRTGTGTVYTYPRP